MKISFLIQGFNVAASRYRVIQYQQFFQSNKIQYSIREFPKKLNDWFEYIKGIKSFDTVFVQRKRLPLPVLIYLKRKGKRIIYDFDDAVMFRNSLAKDPYSLRRRLSFKRMLQYTDMVIAGNNFLKKEALKYHKYVRVLPTPIDGERYTQKEYRKNEIINIGWIGDHGSIHYMESYKDVWEEIGKIYKNVLLTIICDTFIETRYMKLKKVQWRYETEIEELKKLDIGVMPLFNDLWSMGKCGYKILQYMGVGVASVCTPVGINMDVVEDGVNGFWADTKRDWIEKLSILIEDHNLRINMGKRGREKVSEGYTVQACAPKLIKWLRGD